MSNQNNIICIAKEKINSKEAKIIITDQNAIIYQSNQQGVGNTLHVFETGEYQNKLVFDLIVGKAAALIFIKNKVQYVYGKTMSQAAYQILKQEPSITIEYQELVPEIRNRNNDGICPIEASVKDIDDPDQGIIKIKETLKNIRPNNPQ